MKMNVRIDCTKTVKPNYEGKSAPTLGLIPLSVFDKFTHNAYQPLIFAYNPPTPPNSALENGLKKALSEYRVFGGRLGEGKDVIFLNDKGVKLVEASVNSKLDNFMPMEPSPLLCCLYPSSDNVDELVLVQLTRFTCGSLVIGFTLHHFLADGHSTLNFLVTWAKATKGLDVSPLPLHDRAIFKTRNPPQFDFEYNFVTKLGKEYCSDNDLFVGDIIGHKVEFTSDFVSIIKAASAFKGNKKPTTVEALSAHLWRAVTKARGLDGHDQTTHVIVSVNGRMRMNPRLPNEYTGNVVLWAFPSGRINDILKNPLSFAAKLIHDGVSKVDDNFFKSFIDFATYKAEMEDICFVSSKSILCPDIEVNSWLQYPILELDFGGGSPFLFMPAYIPVEGLIYLMPSLKGNGNGSIDAFVFLFKDHLPKFKQFVYSLDHLSCL